MRARERQSGGSFEAYEPCSFHHASVSAPKQGWVPCDPLEQEASESESDESESTADPSDDSDPNFAVVLGVIAVICTMFLVLLIVKQLS